MEVTTENNQYPVLTSSRKGIFFQKDYYDGNQIASIDNTGYNIVPHGYFTYRHMSDDEIFHFNINNITDYGIVSTLYPVFTTTGELDSKYLQYQLNYGSDFKQYAALQKQGGSRTYMYFNKLREFNLKMPILLQEQQVIAHFMINIDNLITLHQYKLYMGVYRKGTILTYFWEQRKLRDISSLITKGTTPLDKSGAGDVNFIKVENLDSNSGEVISGSKISIDEHEGYLKRSQLKAGDILFSIAGTLGRVGIIKSSILPANTNQALAIIRTKEGNVNYISTVLRGRAVTDFIHRNPTVGAQPNLSLEQVGDLKIPYPSLDEQKKIGDYFKRLDHLITLHQRKIKYILKEVFIWIILIKRVVLKKPLSLNYRIMVGRKKLLSILQNRI